MFFLLNVIWYRILAKNDLTEIPSYMEDLISGSLDYLFVDPSSNNSNSCALHVSKQSIMNLLLFLKQ